MIIAMHNALRYKDFWILKLSYAPLICDARQKTQKNEMHTYCLRIFNGVVSGLSLYFTFHVMQRLAKIILYLPEEIFMSTTVHRTLRHSALALALGVCFASPVFAQSNTTGSVFGTAAPGTTVVIENDAGLKRQVVVGSDGRYRVSSLPVGNYTVTSDKGSDSRDVTVVIGGGSEVNFGGTKASPGGAVSVGTVRVRGTRIGQGIDVSQTDTRTVFTSEQLKNIPVQNSIAAVALLAPGVVQADSRYPGTASFGGSAASENAFYINGFPVTNPLTNLGSTTLPFDAISQQQVITGGYGAEFGRSTGGVVNVVTKRGTNQFHHGAGFFFAPNRLRSSPTDIYYENTGNNPNTDGKLFGRRADNVRDQWSMGAYASGPIIRDRLFFYVGAELEKISTGTAPARITGANAVGFPSTGRYYGDETSSPRWLIKLDWNINENHALEFTNIHDVTNVSRSEYAYAYTGTTPPAAPGTTVVQGTRFEDGGDTYIGRYTGHFGDNFTVTALYGQQDSDHLVLPIGYNPAYVYVTDTRPVPTIKPRTVASVTDPDQWDKVKATRLDLEYVLGRHAFRLGYDAQDSTARRGSGTSGPGYAWTYANTNTPNAPIPGSGGAAGPGGVGDYVIKLRNSSSGAVQTKQQAIYLEDRWQMTDNFLLSLGIRNDNFTNYNADKIAYAEQKNQWAPRLGFTWDIRGDASLKVFGTAGRYHLAMPNNVAFRGAGASLNTSEYFAFTGIDPVTGEPLGLRPLGKGPFSNNNEYGQARDPKIVSAIGLKPHFQDEMALGFQAKLGESNNWGMRYVYRKLRSAIDDYCDPRPMYAKARELGFSQDDAVSMAATTASCALFNPGEDNTFNTIDASGKYHAIKLTAKEIGLDKLKRDYQGLDIYLEHPFDGKWYGKIDYTFSRNYGNVEGQLKSDIGQGDVSVTADYDYPEIMKYANGYLPNDRKHYLKAFGFYQFTPEWQISATIFAASGRPKNCMGYYPEDISWSETDSNGNTVEFDQYGNYHHYCYGKPAPRGSTGRLPWTRTLDLGLTYIPAWIDKKVRIGVDVFNVTNSQVAQSVWERNGTSSGALQPYAGRIISYNSPRSVRFYFRYDF